MLAGQSISNRLKRKVKPLMFITTPPKDLASWITLLKAAKIRKYTPLIHFRNEKTMIPKIVHHGFENSNSSANNTFGQNETDITIDNTVNKDTKKSGGHRRFSLNQATCHR